MAQTDRANAVRRERGDAVRASILDELRRRRDAGEPAPTMTTLARVLGCHRMTAVYHANILAAAGRVEWTEPADGIRVLRLTSTD